MRERKYITPVGDEGIYVLDTASWRNFRPVINKDKCTNCGICSSYCPVNSIYKEGKESGISMKYCKGCGVCANECPKKAIDMISEGGEI